jgi:hypothetical protein
VDLGGASLLQLGAAVQPQGRVQAHGAPHSGDLQRLEGGPGLAAEGDSGED